MRIGFDGRFLRRGRSGNGVFSQHLVEGLARIDRQNEYIVYVLEDTQLAEQPNLRFKHMPPWHGNPYARILLTFPLELRRAGVDVFHALYNVPFWTKSRVVLSVVEFGWFTNPRDIPASNLFLAQLRFLTRLSIQRADRIVTPTETMRSRLIQYFTVPEQKVTTIPFGFDERLLDRVAPAELHGVKQKFGIGADYILYVGDLHPRKNLPMLIEAFTRMCQSRKCSHQLVLAGKDYWRAEKIKRKAAESPARGRIIFTGYVSNEDLRALFQGASLFVLPSLDEGYGLPLHEAMASGTPVLASRLPTLQEVARDAALYFDPRDIDELTSVLVAALANEGWRRDLVERGKKCIQQFTWEACCRKLLRVYEEVCKAEQAAPGQQPATAPRHAHGSRQAPKVQATEA